MDDVEKLLIEVAQTSRHVRDLVSDQGDEIKDLRSITYPTKNRLDGLLNNGEQSLRYIIDDQIEKHENKKGITRREVFMIIMTMISTAVAVAAFFKT